MPYYYGQNHLETNFAETNFPNVKTLIWAFWLAQISVFVFGKLVSAKTLIWALWWAQISVFAFGKLVSAKLVSRWFCPICSKSLTHEQQESNDFLPPNSHAVLCTLCLLGKSSNTSTLAAAYLLSISIKLLLYQKKLFANLISVFSVALFYGLNQCYCRFHMIITRISYKSEFALRHLHPSRWKV